MQSTTPKTATRGPLTGPLVAGLAAMCGSERAADTMAVTLAAGVVALGGSGVTVATHWARTAELRHVALTLEVRGLAADVVWDVLAEQVPRSLVDGAGLLMGERYLGTPVGRSVLEAAVESHESRSGGRVVAFPGVGDLRGTITAAEVVMRSAIERVLLLPSGEAGPGTLVNTREFVRPRWTGGELVLDTQPAAGRIVVPFERPDPTPCCAHHG